TYNVYNLLSAFVASSLAGVDGEDITKSLNGYVLKSGRLLDFTINDHNGLLMTSKHENSVSYNQSITYVKNNLNKSIVMFIVDAVSRKYFTSETSWLWDIDFDLLKNSNVEKIILSGTFAYDLGVRFEYTDIDPEKIIIVPKPSDATEMLYGEKKEIFGENSRHDENIFVITCFSDKDKFTSTLK
ncbi:MAG: DUF1727 domain-containing protein, partial [Oscillospiraceae bacterium]